MELIWILLLALTGESLANPPSSYGFCSNRNNKCLKAVNACPSAAKECKTCLQVTTTIRPTVTRTKTVQVTQTVLKTASGIITSTQDVTATTSTTITPSAITLTATATITQTPSGEDPQKRDYASKCTAQAYGSCKAGEYQSACSCLGVMPSTKTVTASASTVTKTMTKTSTSQKTTTITTTAQITSTVDTTIIATTLDPSTTTTTTTTTVTPPEPTVAQDCQGISLYSMTNNQGGQAGAIGLQLSRDRADRFDIVNSRLQPRSLAIMRTATGQPGVNYTPVFLETPEQQQASGNQALTCNFVASSEAPGPDLSCQLGALNTIYSCPNISPNALVLSTPEIVAADSSLMEDCTARPVYGSCQK